MGTVRHRIARSQICNRNYLLFLKKKKNIFGVKMSAESQITALGISLPDAPKPGGVYAPALIVGDMIHVSGHVPWLEGGGFIQGKVGLEVGPEVGVEAARRTGLQRAEQHDRHLHHQGSCCQAVHPAVTISSLLF